MPSPSWADKNLERHHARRVRETPGCFEEIKEKGRLIINLRIIRDGQPQK
jgi:hypothetical protein